jgi:hypothetical protein
MMEIKERLKSQPVINPDPNSLPKSDFFELTERIVKQSMNSFWTTRYDDFQKVTNGIEK